MECGGGKWWWFYGSNGGGGGDGGSSDRSQHSDIPQLFQSMQLQQPD